MQRVNESREAENRWVKPGRTALERLAEAADPLHVFLRPRWYAASHPDVVFHGYESGGRLIAAFPLTPRKMGPFTVQEIAGPYWPFRSIPLTLDATDHEIAAMLSGSAARDALGAAWRLGPIQDNDPALARILPAAHDGGWAVFQRSIAHSFDIDVTALREKKPWPSKSAMRQTRNYANRLARIGAVEYRHATGADWTADDRDAMAEIEAKSWLADQGDGADTKFLDPGARAMWEAIAEDPVLAPFVFCSIVRVDGTPAAFTFGFEIGPNRYQIANNFNEAFKDCSPGRIILTMNYADAAERGVPVINWGAGDAGYKARYGAEPGPEIVDLLFLEKGWMEPLAAAFLSRRGWQRAR